MENNELIPLNEQNFDIESVGEPVEEIVQPKYGQKTNGPQQQKRLNEALELILYKGYGFEEFTKQYAKMYNVSVRTAQKVWVACKDILKERSALKHEEIISNQMNRYMDLLERARLDGNKRVERETLWDMSRIMGLDQRKVDITSGGEAISIKINLSNDPNDFVRND
jgi:hypothetical protein